MYNLSPRFPKLNKGGTPANIAPNTYIICSESDSKLNWAPFLSATERKFSIGHKIYTHALYNPEDECKSRIKGGASLRNRAIRLRYPKGDTPGPTDYDPKIQKEGCKYIPPPVHGKGRKYVCRVPYTIMASAPSIPTHVDENGYDIDPDGNIVKVPPDKHDTSRGPAYYCIPRKDVCFTTRRYHHCCRWSKSKSKRGMLKESDIPASNAYDVNYDFCKSSERDENYRGLARLFSFCPRYTEGIMLRQMYEDLPGPGQYDINTSSFQFKESMSINPRPFVVGAKRFSSAIQSGPGPGEYEICDCPTKRGQFSIKDVPFGFQSRRFRNQKEQDMPGPSNYDVKGPLEVKLMSKRNKYSVVDAPFCQTSERKLGFVPADAYFMPGPADYDIEDTEVEKEPIHASCFKSGTERSNTKSRTEKADPGSYNVSEAFNKNRNRTSHHTGKVPFLSSKARIPGRKSDTPGPADYIGQGKIGEKGLSFGISPRFKFSDNGVPDPGSYTVHPSRASSLYKAIGTHNLRLKESVTRTKLRLPSGVTWQKWVAEMNKQKKLRWFSRPTIEYRHCEIVK